MAVFKDKQRGPWYVSVYYTNWKGESDRKMKRGFKTRKEAVAWENTFLNKNAGDLNMTSSRSIVARLSCCDFSRMVLMSDSVAQLMIFIGTFLMLQRMAAAHLW